MFTCASWTSTSVESNGTATTVSPTSFKRRSRSEAAKARSPFEVMDRRRSRRGPRDVPRPPTRAPASWFAPAHPELRELRGGVGTEPASAPCRFQRLERPGHAPFRHREVALRLEEPPHPQLPTEEDERSVEMASHESLDDLVPLEEALQLTRLLAREGHQAADVAEHDVFSRHPTARRSRPSPRREPRPRRRTRPLAGVPGRGARGRRSPPATRSPHVAGAPQGQLPRIPASGRVERAAPQREVQPSVRRSGLDIAQSSSARASGTASPAAARSPPPRRIPGQARGRCARPGLGVASLPERCVAAPRRPIAPPPRQPPAVRPRPLMSPGRDPARGPP